MLESLDLRPFLEFCRDLAGECSQIAVRQFGLSTARRKVDGTLVTKTDEEIDRIISTRLTATYPTHAVLSEEQTTTYDQGAEYTWVIDPLDGTTNFARGVPLWGVSIALLRCGLPVVGVVDFPMVGEYFSAMRGGGAWRSGVRIAASDSEEMDDEQLLMKCTRTDKVFRVRSPLKPRILGSAAYHICKVADGTALAGIEATPKVWDLAASWLIVVEAGGQITKPNGESIFPLPSEAKDYRALSMPVFAAANPAIMQHLTQNATPVKG